MISLRRRLMMLNKVSVDVQALTFSYTGTWTDTEMAINGAQYRVLQLKSAGTLTLDPRMVGVVPFDVWVVRQGNTGSPGSSSGTPTVEHHMCSCNGSYPDGDRYTNTYTIYPGGSSGANGGWSISNGVISNSEALAASVGSPAYLGSLASVNGTTRSGTAWFSLPSGNTGAGGSGGAGAYSWACSRCGQSGSSPASPGSAGSPGIVVIRIPIES